MDAIRTERLTKRYGSTVALDQLDLSMRSGEVLGFIGPNGAGKTTTIRLLLGLIHPTQAVHKCSAWTRGRRGRAAPPRGVRAERAVAV